MRPSRWDRVTATSGHSSRITAAASSSPEAFSGEKTAAMATERMPDARIRRAASRMPFVVEGHERAAVELVAALQHHHLAAHEVGQVLRPVHEGRQRGPGGQPDAHGGHPAEVAPLHHRVGEVGRPDHGRVGAARGRRLLDEGGQGAGDARRHVRRGGCLHRGRHRAILQEDGVGIGPADVDADPPSHANTERKSRS